MVARRRNTVCARPISLASDWVPPVIAKSAEQTDRINAVVEKSVLFRGLPFDERRIVVNAMESREFPAVRDPS